MGINSCGTTLIDEGTFKNIGAITWDTTAKTAGFTAVGGNGYFVNTTSGAITVTLPSSPTAGDVVAISDYANTADTNNITIGRNGSNIQGTANDFIINTEGASVLLIYVDATKGWLLIDAAKASDIVEDKQYIVATGGTITTSGDFKIHTFTSPGTFCVSAVGNAAGSNTVDYLVTAGAGGGGGYQGGGGAGGFRSNYPSGCSGLSVTASPFPISVGGGGAGGTSQGPGSTGSNSVFSSITSAGGGYGGGVPGSGNGGSGGSGGGGGASNGSGGTGNSPPVSPPQGNPGGNGKTDNLTYNGGGGGGGASVAGTNATGSSAPTIVAGPGGNGTANSINGSSVTRAGGGGGGSPNPSGTAGSGGSGGGGAGSINTPATPGTTNTGGGGGGGGNATGGNGGSGIVIIRYKYQN
jgi:hypothetical protein